MSVWVLGLVEKASGGWKERYTKKGRLICADIPVLTQDFSELMIEIETEICLCFHERNQVNINWSSWVSLFIRDGYTWTIKP